MIRLLLLFCALAAPAAAALAQQDEDAEHRADRLRTIELNGQARATIDQRDRANADVRRRNADAQRRYERERAEWRARVEACRNGDWNACDR